MTQVSLSPTSLEDFCKSHSSLKTKIALLSFYRVNFPKWTDKLLLLLEYLQLMSQIILSLDSQGNTRPGLFFRIIIYLFKLVNPGYLLTVDKQDSWTFTVLIIIFISVLLKLMLLGYIVCASLGYFKKLPGLIFLWKWVFKLQTRGLYLLFTSFYLRALMVSIDGFTPTPIQEKGLITISCLVILIEFLFTLMLETQFCYFLPDKNLLSSKGSGLQIITLVQKFTIQVLLSIFRSDSEAGVWIISCFSLGFNVLRTSYYYRFLPLYNFKALLLQGRLLWVMLCLNLVQFAESIRRSTNHNEEKIPFIITIWIIISVLAQKLSSQILKAINMKLLSTNKLSNSSSPEVFIHKIIATRELKKQEFLGTEFSDKHHITQLVSGSQDAQFAEIFGLSTEEIGIKNVYQLYCESLAKRFPESGFVKLHLAKIYFKNRESLRFPAIIKIINELTQNKWSEYYLTSSLFMYEVENSILWNQENSNQDLDLFTFIKNKLQVEKLKKEVLKETELYMKVSKNILGDVSDIGEIYNLAQLIGESKISVQKTANRLFKDLPDSYVSPFLICARYHLLLNYSLADFDKYMEGFAQRLYKNERYFKASKLVEENLYQDSNGFLLLSSQDNDCGKIVYCTKSFQTLCGHDRSVSAKIWNLFPSTLRAYYEDLFKKGKDKALNIVHRGYLSHMSKYFIEADFCLKYHPYLYQNLCFTMIIREVPRIESREFLLISGNGNIEGASKKISKLLGLNEIPGSAPGINIKSLSKGLSEMYRDACEIMESQDPKTESYQKALDTCSNNLRKIQISSCQSEPSPYEFYGHFEPFFAGEAFLFSVILEKISQEDSSPPNKNYKIEESSFIKEDEASENILFSERETNPPEPLTSHRKLLYSPQETLRSPSPLSQTQEADFPLFSFQTENRDFLLKNQPHQPDIPLTKSQAIFSPVKDSESDLKVTNGDRKTRALRLYNNDKVKKYLSSHSSQQNSSAEKATEKAFKAAMDTKSYPKPFITLSFVFYGVIASTFTSQIIMKIVCDKTLDDLGVKKNLLLAAQERSYREMLIQINALSAAFQINGSIETNGVLLNPAITSTNLALHAAFLQAANDLMMENVNQLDVNIQKRLFTPNVRMYGTYLSSLDYDYETMTTFQAAEKIINAIKAFSKVTYATLNTTGFNSMYYITRNVFNDLEYENQQIVGILQDSVIEEKQSYEFITIFCLIITPLLLIGIGILLTLITIFQYRIEKKQMKALIRVRSSGMQEISDSIKRFQRSLINEEDLMNHNSLQEDLKTVIPLQNEQATSGYSKQHDTRTIKYEKFRKRYYEYIIKIFLYLAPLVVINVWDWISTTKANKIIYHKMDQIQFAQYIGNKVTVTYGAESVLFDTNNTFYVKHERPLEVTKSGVIETKLLQDEIYEKFKELDGSFNQEIQDIIYKDNPECKRFSGVGIIHCNNLVKLGQRTNMMSTISAFQSLMVTKLQDYYNVLQTGTTLKDFISASYINVNLLLPSFVLTAHQSQFIVKIVDNEITRKMKDTKENRSNILVVFSLCLVVVSGFFWFHILKKIREVYNNFKKVLKIFPPGLILSSYLLKKFVISTSSQGGLI